MGKKFVSDFVAVITIFSIVLSSVPRSYGGVPTAGDTAIETPPVDEICKQIRAAKEGQLGGLTFTREECAHLPFRARSMPRCQAPASELATAGETADSLCNRDKASLNEKAASFCALREIDKTQQTEIYCDAYESAEKAQNGSMLTFALDTAAAGTCWAEYKIQKKKLENYIRTKNSAFIDNTRTKGPCAGASMAAALGELTHTAFVLAGNRRTGNFSLDADGNAKEKTKTEVTQVIDVAMSAGLSSVAIRVGVCQYWPQSFICGRRDEKVKTRAATALDDKYGDALTESVKNKPVAVAQAEVDTKEADLADMQKKKSDADAALTQAKSKEAEAQKEVLATRAAFQNALLARDPNAPALKANYELAMRNHETLKTALRDAEKAQTGAQSNLTLADSNLDCARDNLAAAKGEPGPNAKGLAELRKKAVTDPEIVKVQARINVAYSAALIFTTLAALRGGTLLIARGTKKKSEDILKSMFSSDGDGTSFGSSGAGGGGFASFTSPTSSGFTQHTSNQPTMSSAVAAGSPEAFMLPPNAAHSGEIQNIAKQIPLAKALDAAGGGAAGIGGLISSVAGASGASGHEGEIRGAVNTAMSAFGKDSDGYKGGGSARSLASKGESSPDLNLKGLFGGEGKEEQAAAEGELAYRGPASDDIWHSRNPKGNNLFQIISERYDTTQRSRSLSP